ncbi:hypothetical protein H0A36_27100 [Endozoicomonas sp. SM1973]|uniref:DUF6316 domain-containing protein n=1 Tax=Spartinivicinus marinus TaxID=2994442 RepID=A0A853IJX1_9GAMM|nr:DUF6316 family protein [Spartinivicinus marinus]NYZ69687.1 hypothetical protein [Spartinivicinus marinus]
MSLTRKDDVDKNGAFLAKRYDRYFQTQGDWFFYTREGKTLGPYDSKDLAAEGVGHYLEFLSQAHVSTLKLFFSS